MKLRFQKSCLFLSIAIFLLYLIFIFQALPAKASTLFHTIQVGSFNNIEEASKLYDHLEVTLNKKTLDYLRIEKIGKFYTVRIGKFENQVSAESFHQTLGSDLPPAILLKAYVKQERIMKLHTSITLTPEEHKKTAPAPEENPPVHEPVVLNATKNKENPSVDHNRKRDEYVKDDRLISEFHTIQVGSFDDLEKASKLYDHLEVTLNKKTLDYLRIEKIGKFYTVRIGKFENQVSAESFHQTLGSHLPSTLLMKAYVKQKRIMKLHTTIPSPPEEHKKIAPAPGENPPIPEPVVLHATKNEKTPSVDHNRKGDEYVKDHRLISAANEYRQAISDDPDNPALYFKLAMILSDLEFVNEAINKMKKALELSSGQNATYRFELGKLYLTKGSLTSAKEQFLAVLKSNLGLAHVHYYLGMVFLREENYDMAWFAGRTAQSLGYKSEDLISILSALSYEPHDMIWNKKVENMYVRHIVVNTHEEAENILNRISEAELMNNISNDNSTETNTISHSFVGPVKPSEVHPNIASALLAQSVYADPVIVKTEHGFHIVQRIAPLNLYFEK